MKLRVVLLATSASFAWCSGFAQPASTTSPPSTAKTGAVKSTPGALEEVVVTARKRSEKLYQVPISITALSSRDLQRRSVYSISDLADQTPGLTVDSTVSGSGRSDRSFPEYVIRGMVPSIQYNPTTTIFLDGAPLISGQISGLDDLERVEVLKGPQSAYFGRETFAGAVSLVTKDPGNTFKATVDALAASPNYYDERFTVEGPIIPDILTMRAGYRFYSRQGSYDNEAVADKTSEHLGDQSSQSGNVEIVAKPIDGLKIKILGLYDKDDDGPSAQALILPSQSNCLGFWFCGVVPDHVSSQPASNDLVTPAIQGLLNKLASPSGLQAFKPLKDAYGLAREAYHGSINVDYYLDSIGATATSLTAIDNQRFSELQDLANDDGSSYPNAAYALGLPYANSYADYPFFVEDEYRSLSQEFRLTSDANQRFRWLVGANYEWSRVDSSLGGGDGFNFYVGNSPNTSKIYSGFYGLAYDILQPLTINFEGRYQSDQESVSPAVGPYIQRTYNDFLPRVTLQYKFTPDLMAYATYSRGANPGYFNGDINGLPAAEQAVIEKDLGATIAVKPEELTNYELGVKGRFLGGALTASADVYYDIWTQQINTYNLEFFYGKTLETTTAYLNNGKTDLPGVEGDMQWQITPELNVNLSGAINDSDIRSGGCYTCLERIHTENVNGNQLANVSKYQLTFGAEYTAPLTNLLGGSFTFIDGWDVFGRVDYIYKSGIYEDRDNLVRTPDENMINLRAGLTHGPLRLEAFVDNLTNWSGPTSLAAIVDLGNPKETYAHTSDSLVAGLPYLRTYGIRLKYTFGLPPSAPPPGQPPAPEEISAPVAPVRTYLVFFDWDRADLSARARQIVQTAVQASTHVQTTQIEVNGYTDLSGTPAYNQKLSVRRAVAVQTELVHDGVPQSEIFIHGYGESNPLVATAKGVREPQNRRVEIVLK